MNVTGDYTVLGNAQALQDGTLDPSSFKLHPWIHERPEDDEHYDIDRDPLWSRTNQPTAFRQIGYYQCDQIGTPQEVTDARGEIAWSARYRAWGEAKEVISAAARKIGVNHDQLLR
ncbi:YD repeat-containing protein [Burkholderia lata]|uniref:YD repeat-containing protein n=1 Tax=Burkholderia lata (strain ATCC 17760 / DSM 23089 / LMG 22485 / NCIMB 9086 / R18194 / 383) TaxID=482957 RepID=A0A6P2Y8H3_BURL3|nr:RHS domain-containing protein [Burkholderia lata]VWD18297.1 YD repeat-containing protein [Burkholderia lata]